MLAELLAHMREKRNAYKFWIGKPEGKIPFGRCRRRWQDDVMDLRDLEW
jgi:hypothetical protein